MKKEYWEGKKEMVEICTLVIVGLIGVIVIITVIAANTYEEIRVQKQMLRKLRESRRKNELLEMRIRMLEGDFANECRR